MESALAIGAASPDARLRLLWLAVDVQAAELWNNGSLQPQIQVLRNIDFCRSYA
jgi:hypothetical protein